MKYSFVLALFLATSSAVVLKDDCGGSWCNQGLPYDLDEGTLRKAESTNTDKEARAAYARKAYDIALNAKSAAFADFASTSYKDAAFSEKEAANKAAVKAKE